MSCHTTVTLMKRTVCSKVDVKVFFVSEPQGRGEKSFVGCFQKHCPFG